MRDWRAEASRKLADSRLSAAEREEVSRELAGHLQDLCDAARSNGQDEDAATQRAAAELHEDKHLGTHLYRARKENAMNLNDRVKHLWLPGLTMMLASAVTLAMFQIAGLRPYFQTVWFRGDSMTPHSVYSYLTIYVPWLCVLPFLGAAGAYWSRHVGSGRAARLTVGLFPALVFLAIFLVFVPASLAMGTLPPAEAFIPAFAGLIVSWVVIPGAALLLGVLPFLRSSGVARRTA
jgi:hypothetical protein